MKKPIKLDKSKLLGFRLIEGDNKNSGIATSAKLGNKGGMKLGAKLGEKGGDREQ